MHNCRIGGKQSGQHITFQQDQHKYHASNDQTDTNTGKHRFFCTFFISSSHILGNEGRHRLHQGAWDQHGKVDNLTGYTVARGRLQSQAVDKCTQGQERHLGQELLHGQWKSNLEKPSALGIEMKILFFDLERKILLY